ncbi:MAG: cation:dicarboxylate symporter family transporter, partial [Pirellulales bacterium]
MKDDSGGKGHGRSTLYIVGSIVVAVIVAVAGPAIFGQRFRPVVNVLDVGGEIFLRMLQMVVVPLVMASVMSGILGLGDVRKLGRPGTYAVSYYLCTTVLAVVTGLIVVNIVNPGRGIDPALVEDARKEGEQTIAHVAGRTEGRGIQWHNVIGDRAAAAGVSKNVMVPEEGDWSVRVAIDQVGEAQAPARARVQWSLDGNAFQEVPGGEFVAGTEPGIYTTKPVIAVPAEAHYVRVTYAPQSGGTHSVVEAYLVPGAPSIGEIFRNLVLMLFTNNLLRSMVEMS